MDIINIEKIAAGQVGGYKGCKVLCKVLLMHTLRARNIRRRPSITLKLEVCGSILNFKGLVRPTLYCPARLCLLKV